MKNQIIPLEVYGQMLEKQALIPSGMMGYYRAKMDKKNTATGALKGIGGGAAATGVALGGAHLMGTSGLKNIAKSYGEQLPKNMESVADDIVDGLNRGSLNVDDIKPLWEKLRNVKVKGKKRLIASGLLGAATVIGGPSLLGAHLATKKWGKK